MDARHGRQPGRAGAAQRLQQHRLGLVAPVVRQQDRVPRRSARAMRASAVRRSRRAQASTLSPLAGLPVNRVDTRRTGRPLLCQRRHCVCGELEPGIGLRHQAVVHMQRDHIEALCLAGARGGVQQRGGIAPGAVGHGHDGRRLRRAARHGVQPSTQCAQRSLVSVKRP